MDSAPRSLLTLRILRNFKECSVLLPTLPCPSTQSAARLTFHINTKLSHRNPSEFFLRKKILPSSLGRNLYPVLTTGDLTETFCVLSPLIQQEPCNLPGMKPSVLQRLPQNALVHIFSNLRHSSPISFVPPNCMKSRLVFFKSPSPHTAGPSCRQYLQQCPAEDCDQQFESSSTVEVSIELGKQCRKQHFPESCTESGANLQELRESYLITHKIINKTHLSQQIPVLLLEKGPYTSMHFAEKPSTSKG